MKWRIRGRGTRGVPGQMNKLEKDYAGYLHALQLGGKVEWYMFDAIKLRLADKTFYTPDFLVMQTDGVIEIHEVKGGFIEDDAIVKLKVAAATFPFRFILVQKKRAKEPFTFREM